MTTIAITSKGIRRGLGSVVILGSLASFLSGCAQETRCTELASCGGDPTTLNGQWELYSPAMPDANGDYRVPAGAPVYESCTEDLYLPATDPRLLGGEITPARQPTIEPAFYDWCYLLVAGGGTSILLKPPRFYYESGQYGQATINYDSTTGTFSAGLTRTGTFAFDFPALCMRAFGATDGRPIDSADPASPIGDVCKQLEGPLRASGVGEGSYQNTTCWPKDVASLEAVKAALPQTRPVINDLELNSPPDPGGCFCIFDVTETGGPAGRYDVVGNKIIHYSSNGFPSEATFCAAGDNLQLTGYEGDYLFGQKGLRTLNLRRAVLPAATP